MKITKSIMLLVVVGFALTVSAEGILGDIRASVKSEWRKLVSSSADLMELREERKTLPDKSFWFWETDKCDQDAKIRERLHDVREILLSKDSQKIMEMVDRIDREIADVDEELRDLNEERILEPDDDGEIVAKIDKLRKRRTSLEARRRAEAAKVCAELRELGLPVKGEAAEQCLFPVNFGDIIDGVVVAKNVACVVDRLRELMATGDVAAAKRYFGMYLVMVDVQVICFEDYLAKSREGEWRQGLKRILEEANAARGKALENARNSDYTTGQQKIFAHNAEINGATVRAAEAYQKVLDAHEAVISEKLVAAQRVRTVVDNSYETVNLAGDFLGLAKANQEAFDSLLKLELPPVEVFNDVAVQQEFMAITKKLKK